MKERILRLEKERLTRSGIERTMKKYEKRWKTESGVGDNMWSVKKREKENAFEED